jgi:predicted ATPase/transcriptional regulator with XRE-family HTH domain
MRSDAEPVGETRSPFGELLREFRLAANLSQETLAEQAGVSVSGISALERGTRRAPHRDTVALLGAALGLPPEHRIRLQAAAVRASVPRHRDLSPSGNPARGDHNLPLSLTSFHGRTHELRELAEAVCEHRLVTLTGGGGIGKTRLALEAVRGRIDGFPDGIWYVELAPVSDPSFVLQRVASTLGVAIRSGTSESDTAWLARLVEKHLLILLDNSEHLLEAAAAVAQQILERCPYVRILATSREALRIGGEYVVGLDPLAVPSSAGAATTLAEVRASPAATLFLDRARHVAQTLKLGDDAAACRALADICARLDGVPLAIELAAARMNALTLATLLHSVDGNFRVLTTGARTALPRHKTLHALIDWSFELLSDSEQHVFCRLGIFAGGWTLEAAQAICTDDTILSNELLVILSSLVDKSLAVAYSTSEGLRYRMLETTRAYALERLNARGEREPTARRHAEYFRAHLRRQNALWGTLPMAAWLAPGRLELDNQRAALAWSIGEGHDVPLGVAISIAQWLMFEPLSLYHEGLRWSERGLAALPPNSEPVLEAALCFTLAKNYVADCYAERAIEPAMRSVELYRTLSGPSVLRDPSARGCLALSLAYVGHIFGLLGQLEEADRAASEALPLARIENHDGILIWVLIVKALSVNDIELRRSLLDEALDRGRSFPAGYTLEGLALIGFALTEFDAGDVERAQRYAADAADYYRESGLFDSARCWALSIASACAALLGDHDAVIAYAREGLSIFRPARSRGHIDLVQAIASSLSTQGNARDAARLTGACEAAYRGRDDKNVRGCMKALHDKTITLLGENSTSREVDLWLAEGRTWSLEEAISAALAFEERSGPSASTSYG